MKLLDAIKDSKVVMLVLTEKLNAPLGQVAPPSYAGEKRGDPPRYVKWESTDGRLNVLIDSIQSQANRIEPIFANYPELVPDIKVVYPDRTVNLVDVPHRAADATVKYYFQEELAALHKGHMSLLAKRNGTGLLFGLFDSRGTMERLDRMITGVVVLLCYKCGAPQKGQLESCRRRTREIVCRSVAIEPGLCRSRRTRRPPRTELGRNFGDG